MSSESIARALVRLVADIDTEGRVGDLRDVIGTTLFDVAICAKSGEDALPERLRTPSAAQEAALPGARAMSAESTASSMAAAAHALDRDDLHWPSLTHPGGIIWPVVLSVSNRGDVDGAHTAWAATAGYELVARIGRGLGQTHRAQWHATATAGTVGAAAAAAIAGGGNHDQVAAAIGHAASVAGGSIRTVVERSPTGLFHRMHAATTAIRAADVALGGLAATERALEWLFEATGDEGAAEATLHAGGELALREITIRLLWGTGFAHAAMEAALQLTIERFEFPQEIRIDAPHLVVSATESTYPTSAQEAWWNLPYLVARCLLHGERPQVSEETIIADVATRQLVDRTRVVGRVASDPKDVAATVSLIDADRRTSASCETPRGAPRRPPSDEQLFAKWHDMNPEISPVRGAALLAASRELPDRPTRATLTIMNELLLDTRTSEEVR